MLLEIVVRSFTSSSNGSFHRPLAKSQSCCPRCQTFLEQVRGHFGHVAESQRAEGGQCALAVLPRPERSRTQRSFRNFFLAGFNFRNPAWRVRRQLGEA